MSGEFSLEKHHKMTIYLVLKPLHKGITLKRILP